jgi:hypothetical protein
MPAAATDGQRGTDSQDRARDHQQDQAELGEREHG